MFLNLFLFKTWPIQWALALKFAEMRESSISPGLELSNGAASRFSHGFHTRVLIQETALNLYNIFLSFFKSNI
ncbi:hypothetical protein OIU79_026709 [Salix purpurea]|uniref:Uncharacterized protein n=1 Tax=Salix purpurea TaxID=77065 RepID=A0A9Q1A0Q7_SALPP|nr:hypothetical protein OIU79_026709 [Salix purpurea]